MLWSKARNSINRFSWRAGFIATFSLQNASEMKTFVRIGSPNLLRYVLPLKFECLLIALQLDLEMGFADERSVMGYVEGIIVSLWNAILNIPLSAPFPHLSYQEAMARYGSDKPDVRLGMEVRMPSTT
jgi:hypothetical protein